MTFHSCVRSIIVQVQQSQDPEGLRIFYYLVQVRQQPADTVPPHTGSML
jgi:Mago nashi protein